jgi:hypothetical protein
MKNQPKSCTALQDQGILFQMGGEDGVRNAIRQQLPTKQCNKKTTTF